MCVCVCVCVCVCMCLYACACVRVHRYRWREEDEKTPRDKSPVTEGLRANMSIHLTKRSLYLKRAPLKCTI